MWVQVSFVFSQSTRLTDRRTDMSLQYRRTHSKNEGMGEVRALKARGEGIFTVRRCDCMWYNARYCEGISVRPSVCLSVCQTRALWQNVRNAYPQSYTTWKSFTLVFWKELLVGRPILPEILGQTDPAGEKALILNRYSLVAPQPELFFWALRPEKKFNYQVHYTLSNAPKMNSIRCSKPQRAKKQKQVAQLSQRDRAAGCVSYGQKWKTVNGRQHFTDIIGLSSTTMT